MYPEQEQVKPPQIVARDPKIEVTPELGKQIAQIICKEIKESIGKNDKRYKLAKRCEQQYQQMTKWDIAGKDCDVPWDGASNYFVGLTEWIVDAIWARLMNILFSQQPYLKAKGVESSDVSKQDGVTDFTDMVLREKVKLYENTNFFFKQMIKLPFAVLKYCRVKEYDSMIEKDSATVFMNPQTQDQQMLLKDDPQAQVKVAQFVANGYQPAGEQEVWVAKDVELVDAPQLKYIKFEDYVYSPAAKRGERLFWEGDRFWLTINEMMLKAQQDRYIQDSVTKIRTYSKDAQKSGVDAVVAERERMFECFHWYGRLPFDKNNEIALNDPEAIEQEVVCDVSFKEEELLEINHWYYKRKPWPDRVYIRGEYEETEEFEGRAVTQKLYKTQTEINDFHKTLMDNAWLAMQKIFVKKRTLTGEDWEQPEVYPGAMWEEDMQGDIRMLEVGDVKNIGFELENLLLGFAERLSNISAWNVGSRPTEQQGKTTATQFAGTIQEGNIGREPVLQKCYLILKKICQWTIDYYYEDMPEGLERRILGEGNEPIFPTPDNMPQFNQKGVNPYWQQDDIAGQFDFNWEGTSQNSDKQWNLMVANDLQDRYLPHPMIQGNMLATWEILKDGLIARGKKDWQKYLPKREAIIQEMQRMQQEAQMRQGEAQAQNKREIIGQVQQQQQAQAGEQEGRLGNRIDMANKMEQLKGRMQQNARPMVST